MLNLLGNQRIILVLLSINALLSSCKGDIARVNRNNDFDITLSLESEDVNIDQIIFPYEVGILDDILVFSDPLVSPHFYSYALPGFEFKGSFGIQGKGPNDIEDPLFSGQIENVGKEKIIKTMQVNRNKFTSFSLTQALKDTTNLQKVDMKDIYLPPEIEMSIQTVQLNDSILLTSGSSSLGEFGIYSVKTDKIKWIPFQGLVSQDVVGQLFKNNMLASFGYGEIGLKPDKSKICKIYLKSPSIKVFDIDGELDFSIIDENYKGLPDNETKTLDENDFYTDLYLSDSYIYALYQGCTYENSCDSEIHIFDWSGKAKKKIKLNEQVKCFAVDEKRNTIYSVSIKTEDSYISKFSF